MKNRKMVFGIIFLFAIIGICNIPNVFALEDPQYTETIPPGAKIYVDFDLNKGDKLRIDFEVIADGNKDVDFYIKNSDGGIVENWGRYIKGTFYFNAPYDDIFSVYFSNSFSIFTSKTIEFSFYIVEYGKSITINSPITNDVFSNGYNYIDWSTTGDISYVRIELYYDDSFLVVVYPAEYNDGSYYWYLSSSDTYTEGSYYQIKISDYYDNSIYDYSDYFTIEIIEDDNIKPIPWYVLLGITMTFMFAIAIIVPVAIILIRRHKRKSPKEIVIIQEKEIPIKIYCSECGTEILDKTRKFCSKCGTEIIN